MAQRDECVATCGCRWDVCNGVYGSVCVHHTHTHTHTHWVFSTCSFIIDGLKCLKASIEASTLDILVCIHTLKHTYTHTLLTKAHPPTHRPSLTHSLYTVG